MYFYFNIFLIEYVLHVHQITCLVAQKIKKSRFSFLFLHYLSSQIHQIHKNVETQQIKLKLPANYP